MGNMIKLRIEQILQEKRITKSAFADMLGKKKQNINTILDTRNLDKIQEIADILGVDYLDLITDKEKEQKPNLNGYVEYKEKVYKVTNKEDLVNLLKIIEE